MTRRSKSKRMRTDPEKVRSFVLGACGFVLFGFVFYHQADLQVISRLKTLELAGRKEAGVPVNVKQLPTILSSDGRILAQSEPRYDLYVNFDPDAAQSKALNATPVSPGMAFALSRATGIPASELLSAAISGETQSWSRAVTESQKDDFERFSSRWSADLAWLEYELSRHYPLGEAAYPVIGRVGETAGTEGIVGLQGLERYFQTAPPAEEVVLTIDSEIQNISMRALQHAIELHGAESGAAVVIDPATGDILALASWPTMDLETLEGSEMNHATMSRYVPGSTMKPITLAALIESGAEERIHFCNGAISVADRTMRCAAGKSHGQVSWEDGIMKSCNGAAAMWALQMGRDRFIETVHAAGLIERPPLELAGILDGDYEREPGNANVQTATFGFGQSISVTPLAMAGAISAIANDGVRMRLRLIQSVDGHEQPIEAAARVMSPETAAEVVGYMEGVIQDEHGTGHSLRIPGVNCAGKTGTGEKVGSSGRVGDGGHVSMFTGIVPARNAAAVIYVSIDNPTVGYYGADVAGPVYKSIAEAVLRRFDRRIKQ